MFLTDDDDPMSQPRRCVLPHAIWAKKAIDSDAKACMAFEWPPDDFGVFMSICICAAVCKVLAECHMR